MTFTCREVVEILFEYVEGELPEERRRAVQGHLDACPPCVAYVQSYHVTVTLSRKLVQKAPPESLRERFIHAAKQAPHGTGQ